MSNKTVAFVLYPGLTPPDLIGHSKSWAASRQWKKLWDRRTGTM